MTISRRSLEGSPPGRGTRPDAGSRSPARGDVWLLAVERSRGQRSESMRPCLVVSPDELNAHLRTVLIAPMTTVGNPYPFRVPCNFQARQGYVMLDRISATDRNRLVSHVGTLKPAALFKVLASLQEMFAL